MPKRPDITADQINRALTNCGGDLDAAARELRVRPFIIRERIHQEAPLVHWPTLVEKIDKEKARIKTESKLLALAKNDLDAKKLKLKMAQDAAKSFDEMLFKLGAKTIEDRAIVRGWMVSSQIRSIEAAAMTRGVNNQDLLKIEREKNAVWERLTEINAMHRRNAEAKAAGAGGPDGPPLDPRDKVDPIEEDMLRRWSFEYMKASASIAKGVRADILINLKIESAMKSRDKKDRPEMVLSGNATIDIEGANKPAEPGDYPGPPAGHTIPEGATP